MLLIMSFYFVDVTLNLVKILTHRIFIGQIF